MHLWWTKCWPWSRVRTSTASQSDLMTLYGSENLWQAPRGALAFSFVCSTKLYVCNLVVKPTSFTCRRASYQIPLLQYISTIAVVQVCSNVKGLESSWKWWVIGTQGYLLWCRLRQFWKVESSHQMAKWRLLQDKQGSEKITMCEAFIK